MCGRFTLGATATLAAQFDLATVPTWTPRYNIAPTQEVLVVLQPSPQASREARLHRWGLIPPWAKDPSIGNRMINARAETVATKPAFRHAFKERRCLVLADGFYEWHKEGDAEAAVSHSPARWPPLRLRRAVGALGGRGRRSNPARSSRQPERSGAPAPRAYARDPAAPRNITGGLIRASRRQRDCRPSSGPYPGDEMTAYPVSTAGEQPRERQPRLHGTAGGVKRWGSRNRTSCTEIPCPLARLVAFSPR